MFMYSKVFLYCFLAIWNTVTPGKFVYLNNPEKIYSSGTIIKNRFKEESFNKFFFHYINKTKKELKFNLYSSFVSNASFGIGKDFNPGKAGSKSTVSFLKSKPIDGEIIKTISLKPNESISGSLEGKFKKGSLFKVSFGSGDKTINHSLLTDDNWKQTINYQLYDSFKYRLGDKPKNDINGHYGYEICLNVQMQKSGIFKLSYSPRGGDANLIFKYNDKIYETGMTKVYSKIDYLYFKVIKGQTHKFYFYPVGGIDYPVEIKFDILDYPAYNSV